jgi:hypothetical protein
VATPLPIPNRAVKHSSTDGTEHLVRNLTIDKRIAFKVLGRVGSRQDTVFNLEELC